MKRKRKLSNKKIKKRLASVFDCREDQISFNVSEAVSGDVKYHQRSFCFDNGLDLSKILKTAVELRKMMDGMERNGSKLKLPEIIILNAIRCVSNPTK